MSDESPHRCRLCTANDLDSVIEDVAREVWESRRRAEFNDPPWEEASGYWQGLMREMATVAVATLRR
jgi:hypothetical protein